MKILMAAIASFILIQQVSAQSVSVEKVPQPVQASFYTQFPPASLKKWEVRKEGYIAVFKINGRKQYAYYTSDGKWVATESRVKRTRHLPEAVRTAWLNSGYAHWSVHNIRKLETADGQHSYVMHLNDGNTLDANKFDAFNKDHTLVLAQQPVLN
jgi:hypothetical protein